MTRDEALALVREHTTNTNLVKHMLAVEAALVAYARKFHEDEAQWSLCGMLHDVDYEKMKDQHPSEWGLQLLRDRGVSEEIVEAVRDHGKRDLSPEVSSRLSIALRAVDELTGFIVACALVRPDRLATLDVDSVKRHMKKKEFAKGVDRADIEKGAEELGVTLDEHIGIVLEAMKGIRGELGL